MKNKYLKYTLICLALCAVIAVAVYALHVTAEKKLSQYEEALAAALAAAQVTLNVTTPTGEVETDVLDDGTVYEYELYIPEWVQILFTEREPVKFYDVSAADPEDLAARLELKRKATPTELSLVEYVKDVKIMISQQINNVSGYTYGRYDRYYAYGITSLAGDPLLASGDECEITWFEGYDESIFAGDGLYCLVPEGKLEQYDNGNGEAVVSFYHSSMSHKYVDGELVKEKIERECPYTLKIAGTYTGGDWNSIYCPIPIVEQACSELDSNPTVLSVSATLADNSRLDEFREKMSLCFLEPSPENEDIPWRYFAEYQNHSYYHKFYPLGLDINDGALRDLPDVTGEVATLESIVKAGIAVLAVIAAGIPVGCLVIFLSKKRIRTVKEDQ